MTAYPLIQIRDAFLYLPGRETPALTDINLDVPAGGHMAICGPNGAGKTTLLRLMRGHLPLRRGSIAWRQNGAMDASRITGQEVSGLVSPYMQCRLQIYAQGLTGSEFLARIAPEDHVKALSRRLAAREIQSTPLPRLSQGQLRLLLLMAEILRQPEILLLDEWAEGLDIVARQRVLELLEELAPRLTMIFASPRPGDWPDFVQEVKYMRQGSLANSPEPQNQAVNTPIVPLLPRSTGNALFELEHVRVYKERQLVLKDINWRMCQGEHWRITGPNGAGKSTLLRLLAGYEFAAAGGRFRHFSPHLGREIITFDERKCSAPLVSDLSQALYGYPVSALELVLTGADMAEGVHRQYAQEEMDRACQLMVQFLPDIEPGRSIRQLSSGQLRRLFLARALMGKADVLLLDEPCTGLDGEAREAYVNLLTRLIAGDSPRSLHLVLVAHDDHDFRHIPFREARMETGILKLV